LSDAQQRAREGVNTTLSDAQQRAREGVNTASLALMCLKSFCHELHEFSLIFLSCQFVKFVAENIVAQVEKISPETKLKTSVLSVVRFLVF
jgi:hypothetical protein